MSSGRTVRLQDALRSLVRVVVLPAVVIATADTLVVYRFVRSPIREAVLLGLAQFVLTITTSIIAGGVFGASLRLLQQSQLRVQRLIGTTLAVPMGLGLGWAAFSGSLLQRLHLRYPLIGLTIAASMVLAAIMTPTVARANAWSPRRRRGIFLALVACAICIYYIHAFTFLRLYVLLHGIAALAVQILLTVASQLLGKPTAHQSFRWKLSAIGAAFAAVTLVVGGAHLSGSQRARAQIRQYAPISKYAMLAINRLTARAVQGERLADDRVIDGPSLDLDDVDIVLVTVDALRADRLGCYGATTGLTPSIDSIAAGGVVFERAYCTTPHTSYSLASLMTGKYFRAVSALGSPITPHVTMAGILRAADYATAGFFPPAVFSVDGDRLGPLRTNHFEFVYHKEDYASADERVNQAFTWMDRLPSERKFFLWIHLFEPHESYESHPLGRVTGGATPESRYAAEIAAVDDAIGRLRTGLAARNRRVAWIITADHGEEFGEHGGRFHGTTLYDEQLRVPLVLSVPGLRSRRIAAPASHVDILPTIVRGVGQPYPPRLRGRDLGPEIYGALAPRTLFASVGSDRMALHLPWKLLCDVSDATCELYDLRVDPGEHDNLADQQPDRVRHMRSLIAGWDGSHERYEREGALQAATLTPPTTSAVVQRGMQGDRSVALEIAQLLPSLDAPRAVEALTALENLGVRDPRVLSAIALAAGRNAHEVTLHAAIARTRLGDPAGVAGCLAALAPGGSLNIQRRAALALAAVQRLDGLSTLAAWTAAPESRDADVDEIVRVLRELHSPQTASLFRGLLLSPRLGAIAATTLGELRDQDSLEPLRALSSSTPYVLTRTAALVALARLEAPDVILRLAGFLQADPTQVAVMDVIVALGAAIPTISVVSEPARSQPLRATLRAPGAGPGFVVMQMASEHGCNLRVNRLTVPLLPGLQTHTYAQRNLADWSNIRIGTCAGLTRISVALVPNLRQPHSR